MSSIQLGPDTCRGPAACRYRVFTNPKTGAVFAGSHANSRRVGVCTSNGQTDFIECDADYQPTRRPTGITWSALPTGAPGTNYTNTASARTKQPCTLKAAVRRDSVRTTAISAVQASSPS